MRLVASSSTTSTQSSVLPSSSLTTLASLCRWAWARRLTKAARSSGLANKRGKPAASRWLASAAACAPSVWAPMGTTWVRSNQAAQDANKAEPWGLSRATMNQGARPCASLCTIASCSESGSSQRSASHPRRASKLTNARALASCGSCHATRSPSGASSGAGCTRGRGKFKVKHEPLPGADCTATWPPINCARSRQMDKPRPLPPNRRVVDSSACWKGSNIVCKASALMPMPLSRTAKFMSPSC